MKRNISILTASLSLASCYLEVSPALIENARTPAVVESGGSSAWESSVLTILSKDGARCSREFADAVEVNVRPECRPLLAPIVAAIRLSENGSRGREYGVLHPRAEVSYRAQAGWCAATVQKNYDRWVAAGRPAPGFIEFLGARYCPVGADNDPTGLNAHWIGNVTKISKGIR